MTEDFEERRRYFRVSDTINLLHKIIDENQIQSLSHVSSDVLGNCSLHSAIEMLTQEAKSLGGRIERRDPDLYEYLKILDTKINLIAQSMVTRDGDFSDHDKQDVSLSATGLAFCNSTPITIGSFLELRMMLASCLAVIVLYARVVSCNDISDRNTQNPYLVCVEYVNITEDDRELLVKHVVKKQLQQLRDKHEN
jgi:PilZ domain